MVFDIALMMNIGDQNTLGKETFQNIQERKITLPLILLLKYTNTNELNSMQLTSNNINIKSIKNLLNI